MTGPESPSRSVAALQTQPWSPDSQSSALATGHILFTTLMRVVRLQVLWPISIPRTLLQPGVRGISRIGPLSLPSTTNSVGGGCERCSLLGTASLQPAFLPEAFQQAGLGLFP